MEDVQATSPATEVQTPASQDVSNGSPGFSERGRMRRRARFLRKARELAYRDLGGLVYNLHRFGQRNDALVLAKLSTLGQIDVELRALEGALAEHQPVTVLRDAGIAACPRCAAIHGSEDRFCPNCGLAMDRRAERPVAGPPASVTPAPAPARAADPAPPGTASPPPATAAPVDYTTIDRPSSSPQTPTPASPAPGAPAAEPTDQDQPTVIVRPPGAGA
jgi:cell division septation protein DedD